MQLLAVACLSLAAKMEEVLVPSLFDFQVISFIIVQIIFKKIWTCSVFRCIFNSCLFVWNVG